MTKKSSNKKVVKKKATRKKVVKATTPKKDYIPLGKDIKSEGDEMLLGIRIICGIGALAILILLYNVVHNADLMQSISKIFEDNLDSLSFLKLKGNLGGGIIFSCYVILIAIFLNGAIFPSKINIPLLITLFFIVLIIFSGVFIIQDLMGVKEIEFHLNPLGMGLGKIICNGSQEVMLVGNPISCDLENKNLIYQGIEVSFIYIDSNESSVILNSTNETFIAPEKLRYISFELVNETYNTNISVGYPYHFKTFEEYEKDKPIFLAYILSLILLAFVTVPSAVLTIKKLIFNKD